MWREIWGHKARYGGMFLLITLVVAMSSGFLGAAHSIEHMAHTIHEKYGVEDGQFTTSSPIDAEARQAVEATGVKLVDNYFIDMPLALAENSTDMQVRLYENRLDMNRVVYTSGRAPKDDNEIALTRVFAQNNNVNVADEVSIGNRTMTVSGIMTMSDATATFKKNTDFVFNAVTFAYAQVNHETFEQYADEHPVSYTYSYRSVDTTLTRAQRADLHDDIVSILAEHAVQPLSIIDYEDNQNISFALSDIQGDQNMWFVLLVLLMVILAFVFVVLSNSTIEESSASIGTLLANGYRKGELVRHYAAPPFIVGVAGALAGNIAGYAFMLRPMLNIYYANYDYPPAQFMWSWKIFTQTTLVPLGLLVIIVIGGLIYSLRAAPLDFLRGITRARRSVSRYRLPAFLPFSSRFRLRIFFRNWGHFLTLFFGICFGSLLLIFSFGLIPTMQHYGQSMARDVPAHYLYTLKMPVVLSVEESSVATAEDVQPEKFAVTSMTTPRAIGKSEENVSLYGVDRNSIFWEQARDIPRGKIYIGAGLSEKTGVDAGEAIVLSEKVSGKEHSLEVARVIGSSTDMGAYMTMSDWNTLCGMPDDYFNGYASDTALDIPSDALLSVLTPQDMEAIGVQMEESFSGFGKMIIYIAIPIYVVLMFLLTKAVINRSALSISYMKVFGYRNREVNALYVRPITVAVIVFLALSLPLLLWVLDGVIVLALSGYDGNIRAYAPVSSLVSVGVLGIISYAVVAYAHIRAVRKIPLALALKVQE